MDVIDIIAKAGDVVEAEQNLLTLEGVKASMDIPAPEAGTIVDITIKAGDKVKTGDVFGKMQTADGSVVAVPTTSATKAKTAKPAAAVSTQAVNNNADTGAGPSVRRIASELNIDLTKVRGTGNKAVSLKKILKIFYQADLLVVVPLYHLRLPKRLKWILPNMAQSKQLSLTKLNVQQLPIWRVTGLPFHM